LDSQSTSAKELIHAALALLGVERLTLAIHDQSFPSQSEEEIGRGSPYTRGGKRFTQFLSDLGFNAIQLGPQGKTSRSNPSPYDSTLFSKNELSISLVALAQDPYWEGLLSDDDIREASIDATAQRTKQTYSSAFDAQYKALAKAYSNFSQRKDVLQHLWLAFAIWQKQQEHWLQRDSLFEALTLEYGTDDWRQWSELDQSLFTAGALDNDEKKSRAAELHSRRAAEIDFFQFCQWVAHHQHQTYRQLAQSLGMKLYADLQIGFSQRDMWALRYLLLPNYLLGAPPSRTNPDGQPWGYPVLNPDLYWENSQEGKREYGPALRWVTSRIDKLLQDFDGIRIDHPHGIVCPWIYKDDDPNPLQAVQQGARLFESPEVAEHPSLAKFAIVSPEQLNNHIPRYGDAWVSKLTDEQIEQFATIVQLIKERMIASGFEVRDLICEVLSSCPFPLKSILQKHKLGRFRVTHKAQPHNERDVYRSDNAQAEDWIMVGTHDTKPIWKVAEEWTEGEVESWAEYLSMRIEPDDEEARDNLYKKLCNDRSLFMTAIFADLFIGPARNISIFFSDLLGVAETYNRPGIVSDENWVLSVPNDFELQYAQRVERGKALDVRAALALALRAKCRDNAEAMQLADKLEKEKAPLTQG
jgi:4-alpha-glucanotransferase